MNEADWFYLELIIKQGVIAVGVGFVTIYVAIQTGKWLRVIFKKPKEDKQ